MIDQLQLRRRPRIFLLIPGPRYYLEEDFAVRLGCLSNHFEGILLTSSGRAGAFRISNFLVVALEFPGSKGIKNKVTFAWTAARIVLQERQANRSFDLIVTYDPLLTGLIGALLAPFTGAKLITEVNGDYTSPANYWDEKSGKVKWARRRLYMAIEGFVLRRSHGIKLLYEDQVSEFEPLKGKIATFSDFVDLSSFRNFGEQKVVLSVGFPLHVKGMDVLIKAFKRVSQKHLDWQLKILGWYPDLSLLQSYVGGHPRIKYHPPVPRSQMPEHIGRCGIFALASRTEAMGRVLLEAMAAGKPRIGARVGGVPTVIDDGADGLLFEPEDEIGLAALLDKLMGSQELRRALGEAGEKRARAEFAFDKYFYRLTTLYSDVLNMRSRSCTK